VHLLLRDALMDVMPQGGCSNKQGEQPYCPQGQCLKSLQQQAATKDATKDA
jgi:hypothetical protein